jgi:hypothetical protein
VVVRVEEDGQERQPRVIHNLRPWRDECIQAMRVSRDSNDPLVAQRNRALDGAICGHRVDRPRADDRVGQERRARGAC